LLSAFLSCFVIYPLLHELGHVIVLLLVECKIVGFSLFPVPFVACEGDLTDIQTAVVSLGGNVFPVLLLLLPAPKNLFSRSVILMTGTVCAVFCAVSVIGALLPVPFDDMNSVAPEFMPASVITQLLCGCAALIRILSIKFLTCLTNYLQKASVR